MSNLVTINFEGKDYNFDVVMHSDIVAEVSFTDDNLEDSFVNSLNNIGVLVKLVEQLKADDFKDVYFLFDSVDNMSAISPAMEVVAQSTLTDLEVDDDGFIIYID